MKTLRSLIVHLQLRLIRILHPKEIMMKPSYLEYSGIVTQITLSLTSVNYRILL